LYLKAQKWLIWIEVANAWVGMGKIPCIVKKITSTVKDNKVSKIANDGQLKKRLKTTSLQPSTATPSKMWNVKEILDARTVMIA
jgi:hypothetical protein